MLVSQGWLLLEVAHGELQHGGNEGYSDIRGQTYQWDSTVPRHAEVKVGHGIATWNTRYLLGAAVMEEISVSLETKRLLRCALCGRSDIKRRQVKTPEFRCYSCNAEFSDPTVFIREVTVYRGSFGASWKPLSGQLDATELRSLCLQPKSQHSMRPLRWAEFCQRLRLSF